MIVRLSTESFQLPSARIIGRQKLDYDEASMNSAEAGSLEVGRDSVKRPACTQVLEAFAAADREGGLSPDDLELMDTAALWASKPDGATDPLERALAPSVQADRPTEVGCRSRAAWLSEAAGAPLCARSGAILVAAERGWDDLRAPAGHASRE